MGTNYKPELFEQMPVVGIIRNVSLETIEEILPYYIKAIIKSKQKKRYFI